MPPPPYSPPGAARFERMVWLGMVLLRSPLGVVVGVVALFGVLFLLDDGAPAQDERPPEAQAEWSAPDPQTVREEEVASVWVASQPAGAPVTIDGEAVGVTPVWVQGIESGRIRIQAGGGVAASDTTVTLRPGDDLDVWFALDMPDVSGDRPERPAPVMQREPAPTAPPRARPTPPSQSRTAPAPSQPSRATPPEPSRPARARPPASAPSPPVAASGRSRAESRPAESAPAEPRPGTLEVKVPAGSSVMINGRLVAADIPSMFLTSLAPGSYQIRVVYPSSRSEEATVYVGGGAVRTTVTFGPDPAASDTVSR